jgi:hypothetical protein
MTNDQVNAQWAMAQWVMGSLQKLRCPKPLGFAGISTFA